MKNSKLSFGLVTSFIASMALSACGAKVTKNSENIVDFKGYGEESLAVSIEEIYEDYMQSSSGISKYYDQVMEVLIRNAFQKDKAGNSSLSGIKKNYNQIVNEAKDNVKGAKNTAKQNAETNGTAYKTEWQAILSEKGVKDEEELLQHYIYTLEKEQIEDWYFEQHKDELRREYLGLWSSSKEGAEAAGTAVASKASSRYPYHIRHILIKNEDGASDYVRGTITAEKAKLLSNTVELLAQGTMTFGEVALLKSEDSSNTSYGDVGLMTNAISGEKLSMVNEFQLGIYAYDAMFKNDGKNTNIDNALGLNTKINDVQTAKTAIGGHIVEIPYSAFKELGDVADLETNYATGLLIEDGKSALYPRNLLWNRFFNFHGIFVITNSARPYEANGIESTDGKFDYNEGKDEDAETHVYYAGQDDYVKYDKTTKEINYANLAGFKANAKFNGVNQKVLTDEHDNVIIGTRSEFGIHLMIVEKSAYDYDSGVKLEDYYTTAIPGDNDYPALAAGQHTYVDFIDSVNKSEYNSRAETIKSAIKGFDSTYDYRLYEELKDRDDVKAEDASNGKLFGAIDNYIALQREKNQNEQEEGLEKVWKTYIDMLETEYFYRNELDRIVPEGCKIAFTKGTALTAEEKALYEEGGSCHVK